MFRYIALAWDKHQPESHAIGLALSRRLALQGHWQPALQQPGLQVLCTGAVTGSNEAYPLHAAQGVVLGKLFGLCDLTQGSPGPIVLGPRETDALQTSSGRALVRDYWGRYVCFMRQPSGEILLIRDPSGTLPCFRMRHRGVHIVFSWLEDLLSLAPELPRPEVDAAALAVHLVDGEQGDRQTLLQGISQVLPGECVPLISDGSTELEAGDGRLLWNVFEQARLAPIENLDEGTEALRHTVRACAMAWASCYPQILFRLSGGVDSSILLSCLSPDDTAAQVTCINYHSAGIDSDERHYARLAATNARRPLIERVRQADFELPSILDAAPMPAPGLHVGRMGSARMDAELAAAHGARALFSGGGGDQLFFEFRQCWPAADYLRLRGIDRGLPAALMSAARLGQVSVWRALRLALAERLGPAALARTPARPMALLTEAAFRQAAAAPHPLHPAWPAATGLPVGKRTQAHQLMYPTAYYDPLERGAAPELVNPLLSQPLVELCLRIPTWVLTHGGRGRGLVRLAFAAQLPPEIARRRTKGGMEGHIQAVLLNHVAFAKALLLDGELARRGLINRTRTEALFSGPPALLASCAGEVHICLAAEAWLRHWS